MLGGDEVSALVFDLGTFNHRIGYGGEDSPKYVYQPVIGTVNNQKYYYNEFGLRFINPETEVKTFMNPDGTIGDFDLLQKTLENICPDIGGGEDISKKPLSEHPVLFSEPSLHNKKNRAQIVKVMFEAFQVPAIYICKSAVLSGFSCGRSTCLVFDSGHNSTYAVPVNDGYALQKSLIKCDVAGNYVTEMLGKLLEKQNIKINPFYSFNKKVVEPAENNMNNGNKIVFKTEFRQDLGNFKESYRNFWTTEIIRDLKETCLMTSDDPLKYDAEKDEYIPNSNPPDLAYDLPDGTQINLGQDRMLLLERLFNPIKGRDGFFGFHQMVNDAICKADLEIKKELYSNIFICGGNTLYHSFPERLQKQINNNSRINYKIKIITHPSNTERKFSSWIGGSIASSLGTFHQLWLSRAEFDENGENIIERKCA